MNEVKQNRSTVNEGEQKRYRYLDRRENEEDTGTWIEGRTIKIQVHG